MTSSKGWLLLSTFAAFLVPTLPACSGGGGGGGGSLTVLAVVSENGVPLPTAGIFLNERISVEFSSPVAASSVTPDSIEIRRRRIGPDGLPVGQEFTIPALGAYVVSGNRVSFVPRLPSKADLSDAGFLAGTIYRVVIRGGNAFDTVRTAGNRRLGETFETSFETRMDAPLLIDPVPGPPAVVAVGLDLDGNGTVDADALPGTPNTEEFFNFEAVPFKVDTPVGLSRAPLAVAVFLSEPVLPDSVLGDLDEDGRPDNIGLINFDTGVEIAVRATLVQRFLPAEDRFDVVIQLVPTSTLPPATRVQLVVSSGIQDFSSPPFSLLPLQSAFDTQAGPATFDDALVEKFEDRFNADPSTTAEWNVDNSQALVAGVGIGGSGADGPLVVGAGGTFTIDTEVNGGFFNFTEINLQPDSELILLGNNPLRIACTGDVTLAGTINMAGEFGVNGASNSAANTPGGTGIAGGFDGGRASDPSFSPGPVPRGGGQGGAASNGTPGGGGGAGHSRPGTSGRPVNVASGLGGVQYGITAILPLYGGSGGGGGGALQGNPSHAGGGGGAGGGAISFDVAGTFTLARGRIIADGGRGGNGGVGLPLGGAGGGGGSGGSIRIRAFSIAPITVPGSRLSAQGGTGGVAGSSGTASSPGSGGADGRIFFEVFDANRDGQANDVVVDRAAASITPQENRGILRETSLGKTLALSRFLDTGTLNARFSFDGSDPATGRIIFGGTVQDIQIPAGVPETATATIQFQGAHEDMANRGRPDLATVSALTTRVSDLNNFRFLRWQIDFDIGSDIAIAERIEVARVQVRFTFDI